MSDGIDKITLELMCNRKQYIKHISRNDPEKYKEIREHANKCKKYERQILEITKELLCSPETQITLDINEAFDHYIKVCFRHFENKEMERWSENINDEEDGLFTHMYEEKMDDSSDIELIENGSDDMEEMALNNEQKCKDEPSTVPIPSMHSFWGKKITKTHIHHTDDDTPLLRNRKISNKK